MQKAFLPLSCKSSVDHLYSLNFIYVIIMKVVLLNCVIEHTLLSSSIYFLTDTNNVIFYD